MDNQDLQKLYDELRGDYKTLRETVEQKAADAAAGRVDALLEAKLARINEAINEKEAKRDGLLAEMRSAIDRLASAQQAHAVDEKKASRLDRFNRELKSRASVNGRTVDPVDLKGLDAYEAGFGNYLRRGDRGLSPDEFRAMSVGSDPDGGFTVTPDLSGRIVERIFELSPIRQYASVETIGTDSLEGESETDDASGGWVAETGARSDSNNPTIGKYKIFAHEMYAQPKSTQKLLEDSNRDIQAWLQRRTSNKFARLEAAAFATGLGVSTPRGFASYTTNTTADSSRAWGIFEHVATGGSTFGTDPNGVQKLISLVHKLNPAYLANSAFYLNRNTLATLRQLTDASSAGKFVFVPSFSASMPDTVLGYPVRVIIDMADIGSNSLSVAFGDMRETYTIVDRVGMSLLVDPYTDKPNVRFYMRKRVGGDVVNFDSLKFLKFA